MDNNWQRIRRRLRLFEVLEENTRDCFFESEIAFTRYTFRSTRVKTFAMLGDTNAIARDLRREEYIVQFAELLAGNYLVGHPTGSDNLILNFVLEQLFNSDPSWARAIIYINRFDAGQCADYEIIKQSPIYDRDEGNDRRLTALVTEQFILRHESWHSILSILPSFLGEYARRISEYAHKHIEDGAFPFRRKLCENYLGGLLNVSMPKRTVAWEEVDADLCALEALPRLCQEQFGEINAKGLIDLAKRSIRVLFAMYTMEVIEIAMSGRTPTFDIATGKHDFALFFTLRTKLPFIWLLFRLEEMGHENGLLDRELADFSEFIRDLFMNSVVRAQKIRETVSPIMSMANEYRACKNMRDDECIKLVRFHWKHLANVGAKLISTD